MTDNQAQTPVGDLVKAALAVMATGRWSMLLREHGDFGASMNCSTDVPVEIARLAALPSSELVGRDVTEAMVDAGEAAWSAPVNDGDYWLRPRLRKVYAAMLAASPPPVGDAVERHLTASERDMMHSAWLASTKPSAIPVAPVGDAGLVEALRQPHPDQTSPMTVGPEAFLDPPLRHEAEAEASALCERSGIDVDDWDSFKADLENTLIEFAENHPRAALNQGGK